VESEEYFSADSPRAEMAGSRSMSLNNLNAVIQEPLEEIPFATPSQGTKQTKQNKESGIKTKPVAGRHSTGLHRHALNMPAQPKVLKRGGRKQNKTEVSQEGPVSKMVSSPLKKQGRRT